ncbi:MAG TPA: hybrid sensor histidine kinase/response regulator [Steroidobacteraceae bacterium]|nr:hybrid sensor histidine kinase/response regulator [Steroidobacteraceae bacterium]
MDGNRADEPEDLRLRLADERALRAEAERVSRLKDDFLSTLGHELRAPLNAILGWSRLLESGRLAPEDVQRGGQTIDRNVRMLAQLVDDLIDMSGLLSGRLRMDPEETDLAQIVEAALDIMRPTADAKGVRMEKNLPAQACLVFGDRQRLQQVIWNLLNNAVKFTQRGGLITTTLARVQGNWEVKVTDSGIGLSTSALELIFDRFGRHEGPRRGPPGLGLGLVIVKQVIELHGGRVWATSAGEGHGATFYALLPRLAPHEPVTDVVAMESADLHGLRVLLVDDDPETLERSRQNLSSARALVATASSADSALDALRTFHADVLVADLSMPGRNGYDLIRSVRAKLSVQELPAIALVDFARPEDAVSAHDAGYQMHLTRPADADELVSAVAQLTRRS